MLTSGHLSLNPDPRNGRVTKLNNNRADAHNISADEIFKTRRKHFLIIFDLLVSSHSSFD